ncbi:MAG: AsmA-like C-terminal region-containing protein, partial [Gemmataceae bacterium]
PRSDIQFSLSKGKLAHPRLPEPLQEIHLQARLVNQCISDATIDARLGKATLQGTLSDLTIPNRISSAEQDLPLPRQAELSLTNLEVTADLLSALPSDLAFIKEDFSPSGPISVRYQYQQPDKDRPAIKKWTVQPLGMAGSFIDFPYPLTEVKGTILLDTAQAPLRNIRIDMSGRAGGKPASLVGTIRGPKQTSEVRLEIKGSDILLDDRILTALPPRAKKVVGQFLPAPSRQLGLSAHPLGHGDFRAWIHRDQGKTQLNKVFNITFRQCEVLYDQFPLPLKNVSGVLWLHPDHWEAKDFHGIHDGGEIRVNGRSYSLSRRATVPLPNGESSSDPERVHVRIQGKNIALDREFENALAPLHGKDRQELQSGWKRLRLAGRLNFEADVVDLPDQPQDIDVGVDVQGLTMQPTFFPYRLEQLRGSVRYSKGKLHLRDLSARHGDGTFNLPTGLIQISGEGGFTAWLKGLTGKHIQPEKEFLEALPESLRRVVETIRLRNPLDLAASLTLAAAPGSNQPIQIWWEGAVALQNAAFRTGVEWKNVTGQLFSKGFHDGHRLKGLKAQVKLDQADILGQPLTNLFGRMEVDPETPDIVRLRDLKGDLFGGTLAGQAHLVTSPQLRYDVLLEALGIQLDLVGRHNLGQGDPKAQLQGPCRAAIHLHGEGDDLLNLKGNGRVDVPQGKMGELPVLLDLVKAFGLHVPDRTAFEQAHMVFAIEGPRIQVQQLDLYGNAVSLSGLGGLDLDGSNIQLNFTATPGRMTQLLPAGIGLIPQAISSSFLKIKMRGSLGKGTAPIRFDKELIPGVMEPLLRAMGGS